MAEIRIEQLARRLMADGQLDNEPDALRAAILILAAADVPQDTPDTGAEHHSHRNARRSSA